MKVDDIVAHLAKRDGIANRQGSVSAAPKGRFDRGGVHCGSYEIGKARHSSVI